ncbi:HET-domain-containing protein [Thozetella sp. PMI_491]|nr:HET-domain-containing protein [Thozetella sp. PMI_491]
MENIFKQENERRRQKEFALTSTFSNLSYYGSPARSGKKFIWPPLAKESTPANIEGETKEPSRRSGVVGQHSQYGKLDGSETQASVPSVLKPEILQDLTSKSDVLYHPLHEGGAIRILELQPGNHGDTLVGRFHYADLKNLHLQYEALSYVWGETYSGIHEEMKPTIQCNGRATDITPNLHQALVHIRSPSAPLFLWADAICINQDDEHERSHQVGLMGAIYGHAARVLMWISEYRSQPGEFYDEQKFEFFQNPSEFDDVRAQRSFGAVCDIINRWQAGCGHGERATYAVHTPGLPNCKLEMDTFEEMPSLARDCQDIELMRMALDNKYSTRRNMKTKPSRSNWGNDCAEDDEEPLELDRGIDSSPELANDSQFWLSIADLFDQAWFWRVWVVQEAVLAQRASVRWCRAEIDWKWIGLAAAILRTSYHGICENLKIGGVYNAYLMYRMSPMSDLPPPTLSFPQLLRLTRQFEVTDPRDRVYGLLGLKTQGNEPDKGALFLPVDYTISATELWQRLAWKLIQSTASLSLLSSVQYAAGKYQSEYALWGPRSMFRADMPADNESALPSWVPNWQEVHRATIQPWDADDSFSAGKGLPFVPGSDLIQPQGVLRAEGVLIGTVGYEGAFMWRNVDTGFLNRPNIGSFFATEFGLRLLSHTYAAGRNSYGSLVDLENETPLADFAAHLLALHDRADARLNPVSRPQALSRPERPSPATDDDDGDGLNIAALAKCGRFPLSEMSFSRLFKRHPDLEERLRAHAKKGDPSRFLATSLSVCERRRLFLTFNGFLGLGPDTVQEGDILAVLAGCDVPVLLRPVSQETMPSDLDSVPVVAKQRYLFVGECFVQGLMSGEAIEIIGQGKNLTGPVLIHLIHQEIIHQAQKSGAIPSPTTIVDDVEQAGRQKEAGSQEHSFHAKMFAEATNVIPEKTWFDIW